MCPRHFPRASPLLLRSTCPACGLQPTPDLCFPLCLPPWSFLLFHALLGSLPLFFTLELSLPTFFYPIFVLHHMDIVNEGGGMVGGSSFARPWSEAPCASHLCVCNSPPFCCRMTPYAPHQIFIYLKHIFVKKNLGSLDVSRGWMNSAQRWVSEEMEKCAKASSCHRFQCTTPSMCKLPPVSPLLAFRSQQHHISPEHRSTHFYTHMYAPAVQLSQVRHLRMTSGAPCSVRCWRQLFLGDAHRCTFAS